MVHVGTEPTSVLSTVGQLSVLPDLDRAVELINIVCDPKGFEMHPLAHPPRVPIMLLGQVASACTLALRPVPSHREVERGLQRTRRTARIHSDVAVV